MADAKVLGFVLKTYGMKGVGLGSRRFRITPKLIVLKLIVFKCVNYVHAV